MEYLILILMAVVLAAVLLLTAKLGSVAGQLRRLERSDEVEQLRRELGDLQRGQRQEAMNTSQAMTRVLSEQLSAQSLQLDSRLRTLTMENEQRLRQLSEGLGEMRALAAGVGDLKKILGNVKTRGILGEVQLGAILSEILAPQQYSANVMTKAGSRAVVEFAVKLPTEDGSGIWLPIDAKFPADAYASLRTAAESGDPQLLQSATAVLHTRIKSFARDIRDKYIDPPNTTDFGIMFLPFEGLYAEIAGSGLIETLQRDYKVSVAGPSTMAALLNSLQMSFRAFDIQQRSSEVWTLLEEVKTEFDRFAAALSDTQSRLSQAEQELDKLVGVRTRALQKRLSAVGREG